jgi:hypothetical protein
VTKKALRALIFALALAGSYAAATTPMNLSTQPSMGSEPPPLCAPGDTSCKPW